MFNNVIGLESTNVWWYNTCHYLSSSMSLFIMGDQKIYLQAYTYRYVFSIVLCIQHHFILFILFYVCSFYRYYLCYYQFWFCILMLRACILLCNWSLKIDLLDNFQKRKYKNWRRTAEKWIVKCLVMQFPLKSLYQKQRHMFSRMLKHIGNGPDRSCEHSDDIYCGNQWLKLIFYYILNFTPCISQGL